MKANNWITVNNTNGEPTEMLLTAKGKYEKIKLPRLRGARMGSSSTPTIQMVCGVAC
jgi:hypothetical protein